MFYLSNIAFDKRSKPFVVVDCDCESSPRFDPSHGCNVYLVVFKFDCIFIRIFGSGVIDRFRLGFENCISKFVFVILSSQVKI